MSFTLTFPTKTSERTFSSTSSLTNWLAPKRGHNEKNRKGRPRMRTGGSTKGTTVVWGDYGLRMRDHDRRIAAKQLQIAADAIKTRLRGQRYRLYTRVCANIGVYTKGNEVRMGKGKGSFDYWAARVAVSRVLFELKGDLHEQIVRDAFRLAGNKLPGLYEFVRKGDPPVMGITKVEAGTTLEQMQRPKINLPMDVTAGRISATTPP
ncbi:MAG: hypothetical protein LQ339_003824 [Xanthoria mediterranea]|nr:MAG: hypothetical protein LQ339_003824 [Xanthoria mediterranea]